MAFYFQQLSIKKITISEFLAFAPTHPIIDVRSPGEYHHAHIPHAYSLPLFTDEERKIVGTAYKQQGKQIAIKKGLDFFGVKMKSMVEEAERLIEQHNEETSKSNTIIVHCWRGGMRSAGVAWLLDLYGFDVYVLVGGYKAFRNWILQQFEQPYQMKVLGGYTGSGKTPLLQALQTLGEKTIDLEALAHHKGSAFGGIGQPTQPSQEMFENKLALSLYQTNLATNKEQPFFWIEDESQRIGTLNIPHALWKNIRQQPVFFLDIPFEERLEHILEEYAGLDKEKLCEAVLRIQKRFGPAETKQAIQWIQENNIKAAFTLLLRYYDKTYTKALHSRDELNQLLRNISLASVDPFTNAKKILAHTKS